MENECCNNDTNMTWRRLETLNEKYELTMMCWMLNGRVKQFSWEGVFATTGTPPHLWNCEMPIGSVLNSKHCAMSEEIRTYNHRVVNEESTHARRAGELIRRHFNIQIFYSLCCVERATSTWTGLVWFEVRATTSAIQQQPQFSSVALSPPPIHGANTNRLPDSYLNLIIFPATGGRIAFCVHVEQQHEF